MASPAFAQTAATPTAAAGKHPVAATTTPASAGSAAAPSAATGTAAPVFAAAKAPDKVESVVVTGSILRNPNLSGANPVTRLTATDLQRRGITTVASALQQLSANGSGNLPTNFTGNGAFASGASGVSLRGLTTDSTLVLIDGQRAAYYPLSDDGERNFVDTNSIPNSIVQTIDVQQDGGSATYGADAVAGVVNIITRKQIVGFEGGAEGGLSQRTDAGHQRLYATYGYGDLKHDNYNVWINGEYQQDDLLMNRDRGFPYNTGNLIGLQGTNGNPNGLTDGAISGIGATRVGLVRPATADGTYVPGTQFQPINSALGCSGLTTHVVSQGTVCEQNTVGDYKVISPSDRRISSTAKATVNLSPSAQAYAMFTYSQNQVYFPMTPSSIRQTSASGDAGLTSIVLPAVLSNGTLNPNNPFAAQGQDARLYYRFADLKPTETDFNQTFRGSGGVNGSVSSHWGGDWDYNVSFVGMTDSLRRTITGVPTYQGILSAIADGSYNFSDPSQNSGTVRNAIAPRAVLNASSQEYALDVVLSKGLFELPGGMVTLGIGGQARYESLSDPSLNPDDPLNPNAQYLPQINPFSAFGTRKVGSTFFEVGIPVVKQLSFDVSGRYDHYSEGFSNFAPKVGVVIKPIQEVTLRGTFSKGFRVPSFAETGGQNVGFISYTPSTPGFINQHLNAAGNGPDLYAQTYSVGLNTVGNTNLKPEKSTNFTGGVILQPKPWISMSADYYYIKKDNYIVTADFSTALNNYFNNLALPVGTTVTPSTADPDHPNGMPSAGYVNIGYINAASLVTDGFDLSFTTNVRLPGRLNDVKWISNGTLTYVNRYNIDYPGLGVERYAGTIGPDNITSASGTPRWRSNWQNTFIYKRLATTVNVNYTSGYKLTAEDVSGPGTRNDCSQAQQGFVGDPQRCHVNGFINVDLTINYALNDKLNLYTNIYNVFDKSPSLDTGTYGGYQYNPSWGAAGILGRAFRFGVTGKF
ncbi:TonB-dependent receptor [Lichenicola cladoniae]|uniref:TonB-dependent receptor n=1 Tax=Lichenicola cladoniae TaxID=1484109 RepID=A0A6M8HLE8_9PROT|nr:TonB-dependent receptor [Lichenicola cladoniae]NPD68896.1 TonB-dependent receptor [Acetobacteraceae bacterium]QKE89155.1 TonB-dependent receptor [Lichenicola cladoniae]